MPQGWDFLSICVVNVDSYKLVDQDTGMSKRPLERKLPGHLTYYRAGYFFWKAGGFYLDLESTSWSSKIKRMK
jgi:hypothetical protein